MAGALCDECKVGFFHLSEGNPEGCLQCFCMGVTRQCSSSSWSRDQVRVLSTRCLCCNVPSKLILASESFFDTHTFCSSPRKRCTG